ncbi:lytic murein transglycosylase [Nocardioides cynanchi]|uniref:lytic transglycosylase domain-containing protein n=1 Tax=Nocardioides cynanchi TaxID=2558918 RepID=UPI0012456E09|nr:lytic murein transglycosylase [Nocardioides cynanchi]
MSMRSTGVKRASALLPLAVLSIAWTASLAQAGTSASADAPGGTLPDGSQVPAQAVHGPASLTSPGTLTKAVRGNSAHLVATASASGIPAVAIEAYQRAQTVINAADPTCHLPWELVAAIGRVESDHGRVNGNRLSNAGVATPGIYGLPLDGTHGTALIRDTDAGQYDHDTRYDRAVGPMQFIPSTWAIVGVDADNDGQRNPQDIYDASLASAVYLCSGTDDLSTDAGQKAAVFRYNHSQAYVDLVLAIMHAYQNGDFMSVPNGTTTTSFTFGAPPVTYPGHHHATHHATHHGHHTPTGGPTQTTTTPTSGPTAPTTGPTSGPSGGPTGVPSTPSTSAPVTLPTLTVPTSLPTTLPTILTVAQATAQCLAEGLVDNPLNPNDAFDQCVYDLTH